MWTTMHLRKELEFSIETCKCERCQDGCQKNQICSHIEQCGYCDDHLKIPIQINLQILLLYINMLGFTNIFVYTFQCL